MTIYGFKKSLNLILFSLFILSVPRFFLYFYNLNIFKDLSKEDIFLSFLNGLRFDLSIFLTFGSLPILLMIFGFWQFGNRLLFIILYIIYTLNFISIGYFPQVERHISNEFFLIWNDLNFIIDIIPLYISQISLYSLSLFIIFKIWLLLSKIDNNILVNNHILKIATLILISILMILGIRGKISGKPLSFSDAFIGNNILTANLSISGTFSVLKSKNRSFEKFMSENEAEKIYQNLLISNDILNFNYKNEISKPNIFLIVVESLTPKFIDENLTPNLYKIKNESIDFTNFYANGQRSVEGITSILTAIPSIPNFSDLGYGREMSNKIRYLGKSLKSAGYSTIGIQGSKRSSFRIDQSLKIAGFDEVFGAEDMRDLSGDEVQISLPFNSVWDGNIFRFINSKKFNEPFFTFIFTASTHLPFKLPNKQFEKFKHDEKNINGYLNNLSYFDNELGKFIKEDRYKNSIFIITADHVIGNNLFKSESISDRHKIPFYIYAPQIFEPHQIDKIFSQADIQKILFNLLNININDIYLDTNDFAILREGDKLILLDSNKSDKNIYLKDNINLQAIIQIISKIL